MTWLPACCISWVTWNIGHRFISEVSRLKAADEISLISLRISLILGQYMEGDKKVQWVFSPDSHLASTVRQWVFSLD